MKVRLSSQFARSSGWLLPVGSVVVCGCRLSRQPGFLCTSWASPGLLLPPVAPAGASTWEGSSVLGSRKGRHSVLGRLWSAGDSPQAGMCWGEAGDQEQVWGVKWDL